MRGVPCNYSKYRLGISRLKYMHADEVVPGIIASYIVRKYTASNNSVVN